MVEQVPVKHSVAGSTPASAATFEELYKKYRSWVRNALARDLPNDFEDIEQEVWIRLSERLKKGVDENWRPQAWMRLIIKNLIIDEYRRRQKRQKRLVELRVVTDEENEEPFDQVDQLPSTRGIPDEELDKQILRSRMLCALLNVSKVHQQLLVLRGIYGLTYGEMAKILRTSQAAIETALWRARKAVIQQYSEIESL